MKSKSPSDKTLNDFLQGKSTHTLMLFHHFVNQFKSIGDVSVIPAKTMLGIATPRKRIAYVTQLGKNFVHVVFPFEKPFSENLCFIKIAQVPGDDLQFNHHLRLFNKEDVNEEVKGFMKMALENGV